MDARAVFVDVVVRVDVFDCVDVAVSTIPLKRSSRFSAASWKRSSRFSAASLKRSSRFSAASWKRSSRFSAASWKRSSRFSAASAGDPCPDPHATKKKRRNARFILV